MSFALRAAGAAAGITVLTAVGIAPSGAQTPADTRPPCRHVLVAMEDTVDSAKSKAGDVFQFRLVDATTAPDGTALPIGTLGYGVVANASHAERGGRGGYLALETRFFARRRAATCPRSSTASTTTHRPRSARRRTRPGCSA